MIGIHKFTQRFATNNIQLIAFVQTPLLKQGVVPNTFKSYPEHLQPPGLKRCRVLIRNTPPSTEDLPTQSEHRTPESKNVKAHTLTFVLLNNIHTKFTCAIQPTELIKTIINRYALIRIKYETTKNDPGTGQYDTKVDRFQPYLG